MEHLKYLHLKEKPHGLLYRLRTMMKSQIAHNCKLLKIIFCLI